MQRSQKSSGHSGIRHTLALIGVLAAMTGALLGLTSCGTDDDIETFVSPRSATMAPGESKKFELLHTGLLGGYATTGADKWSATGGSISPSGVFVAPEKSGTYTVTATDGGKDYTSQVTVVAATTQSGESSPDGGHLGGKIPQFTIDRPRVIVEILTYHWDYNDHKLGTIALKNVETGKTYGPWKTVGGTGQGGVENAYWLAHPNIKIPAGTYEIVDSSPSTWFTNDQAKGFGVATIDALK